jgi:hypothetical protein
MVDDNEEYAKVEQRRLDEWNSFDATLMFIAVFLVAYAIVFQVLSWSGV